jgi:hypothetical protein
MPTENVTLNFQTNTQMRDALQVAAQRQERSMSATIRLAVRAWLEGQALPAVRRQEASADK